MGFCVSSLVLGILSVITTLLPTAAFVCSIVGLTLGLLAYVDRRNSTARAGIFLNLLGLLLVI